VLEEGDRGQPSPGAVAELRAATAECHRRLERRLDIKARFSTRDHYRSHLEGMLGFQDPFEQQLSRQGFGKVIPDFQQRCKSALLVADLQALGGSPEAIASLPRCLRLPSFRCEAAALGGFYVLEGATLGGRVLLPLVQRQLGVTAGSGGSYLGSYGEQVSSMWRRFSDAVEAWCTDSSRRRVAAAAAVGTFNALEQWLCELTE